MIRHSSRLRSLKAGLLLCILSGSAFGEKEAAPGSGAPLLFPDKIEYFLEDHCWSRHDDGLTKGDVRLDHLGDLTLDARLDMLNRVQEQVYLGQMPPKDGKSQPSETEREELLHWISTKQVRPARMKNGEISAREFDDARIPGHHARLHQSSRRSFSGNRHPLKSSFHRPSPRYTPVLAQ